MKICFFGDGGSVHIIRWVEYFVNRNHEVHLITFANIELIESLSESNNFHLHKIGNVSIGSSGGNWKYLLYLMSVKKLLNKIKPDIVNAHYVTSYGFIASLLKIKSLVLSAWGSDILVTPNKNYVYKYITKFALCNCTLITSDSEYMAKIIGNYTKKKVITIPMGVDKLLCKLKREEHSDKIRILSARTIDKNCNVEYIIKAFKKFNDKHGASKLIITNNGPEILNIKKLIDELDLNDKIELQGFVTRDNLVNLLLTSDLYVSIPTSDSTSVTLLESMACGSIPVVSNLPANCEWITDSYNGLVLMSIDEHCLFEVLMKAVQDKDLKKRCEVENRKIILQRAIWEDNMSAIEKEYLSLLI
jgi:L-malate glycosyltransferase